MSHENVIEVSFNQHQTITEELQEFLNLEDPIEELLNEFHQEIDPAEDVIMTKERDFKLQYKNTPRHMTDTLLAQIGEIKDDIKRLSYYLDEMNLDC